MSKFDPEKFYPRNYLAYLRHPHMLARMVVLVLITLTLAIIDWHTLWIPGVATIMFFAWHYMCFRHQFPDDVQYKTFSELMEELDAESLLEASIEKPVESHALLVQGGSVLVFDTERMKTEESPNAPVSDKPEAYAGCQVCAEFVDGGLCEYHTVFDVKCQACVDVNPETVLGYECAYHEAQTAALVEESAGVDSAGARVEAWAESINLTGSGEAESDRMLMEEARQRSSVFNPDQMGHLFNCNYWMRPVGHPGCVCTPEKREAAMLRESNRIVDYIDLLMPAAGVPNRNGVSYSQEAIDDLRRQMRAAGSGGKMTLDSLTAAVEAGRAKYRNMDDMCFEPGPAVSSAGSCVMGLVASKLDAEEDAEFFALWDKMQAELAKDSLVPAVVSEEGKPPRFATMSEQIRDAQSSGELNYYARLLGYDGDEVEAQAMAELAEAREKKIPACDEVDEIPLRRTARLPRDFMAYTPPVRKERVIEPTPELPRVSVETVITKALGQSEDAEEDDLVRRVIAQGRIGRDLSRDSRLSRDGMEPGGASIKHNIDQTTRLDFRVTRPDRLGVRSAVIDECFSELPVVPQPTPLLTAQEPEPKRQVDKVRFLLSGGLPLTLGQIARGANCTESSAASRIRDLRLPKFGGLTIVKEKVKRGGAGTKKQFTYRMEKSS